MDAPRYAFVTLCTSDAYLPGALVTLHSVLDVEPAHPLQREWTTVALTTPATVSAATVQALRKAFDVVIGVESIVTQSWAELELLGRKDLAATLTKLHLFRLTQYEKIIFLDADTLVLRPLSHLFQLTQPLAAAPDQGWPDAFNSGVLVATPSLDTFDGLMDMMRTRGSWDGGDQGLLNDFFPDWHRLSFTYNVTPSAYYTYRPAYQRHGQEVSVLHFIGANKPWNRGWRPYGAHPAGTDYDGLVGKWYDVFEGHYGTASTYEVGDRVVVPVKSFLRKEFSGLPLLPVYSKPSLAPAKPPSPQPAPSSAREPAFEAAVPAPQSPLPPSTPTLSVLPPSPPAARPVPVPAAPTRIPSPPQLTWDPARSSPPRDGPLQMRDAIPTSTNLWDEGVPRDQQRARFEPPAAYPPPPRETHDWYKEVMRSKPDPSRVRPVFPWEEPVPASNGTSTADGAPGIAPAPTRTFSDEARPATGPPPALRFAGSGGFSNAWDAVPGIQRYVQQLNKRHTGGHSRKSSGSGSARVTTPGSASGSGTASGEGAAVGEHSKHGTHERRAGTRRSWSGSTVAAAEGRTSRASEVGLPPVGGSGGGDGDGTADARAARSYNKDGDASSRDGDDEDDEDEAEMSAVSSSYSTATTTGGDDAPDDELESDPDSEGIDRITIRFRRALQAGELDPTNLRRGGPNQSGSPSSNESNGNGGDDGDGNGRERASAYYSYPVAGGAGGGGPAPALAPKSPRDPPMIFPQAPTPTRRDSRYVPTSPRQPRSPQSGLATPQHHPLPFLGAPVIAGSSTPSAAAAAETKPALRLQLPPTTPGGTVVSPRLAAQALRNSTAARLTATGTGSGEGPPLVRATRVFSPETDTGVVKQQGLAALQRFVENMENMQAQQQEQQQQQQRYQQH